MIDEQINERINMFWRLGVGGGGEERGIWDGEGAVMMWSESEGSISFSFNSRAGFLSFLSADTLNFSISSLSVSVRDYLF